MSGLPVVGLVAAGFLVVLATTDAARTQLTIIGATLEALGIALVALDFWAPAGARALRWLGRANVRARLRHIIDLLMGRRRHWVSAGAAMPVESAGAVTPQLTSPPVSSFEEVSARLQAITDRITTIEGENMRAHGRLSNEIGEREQRLRAEIQDWIARSKDQYLPWRIIGLVVALSGTVALAAANLA